MTTQTINLDLIPQGVPPIIHVSQYDKGQTWLFNLFIGNVTYNVPAGSAVTIQGTKRDSTGFEYACTYSGSQVTAIEQQQMTVLAGDTPAELRISNNGDIIGSINFIIRVEPAALSEDTVISETDLPLIEQAVEIVERIPEIETELEDIEQTAEAWAVGTRGGEAVPSTAPQHNNNAKYYAEHFVGYVTDAQYTALQTIFS